jgi:lysophosphatidate acyltransferase
MTAAATMGIAIAATMTVAGYRYDVNWVIARMFYTFAGAVMDIHVEVEGEEHLGTKPAVLLSNHQSMLDILFIGRMMPKRTSILAKKSLQYTPLGPFMIMSGAVFIDRGNNARAVRSLEAAGELMKDRKISLWMYPEGTRHLSPEPQLLSFKKGAFHLAVQSSIPIIPIVTENYWKIYRQGFFGTGVVKIRVLPPISTDSLTVTDVPELTTRVRNQMLDALRDISINVEAKQASEQPRDSQTTTIPKGSEPDPLSFSSGSTDEGVPDNDVSSEQVQVLDARTSSMASLGSSDSNHRSEPSENGTETEEDEGMVLVGRPV